MLFDRNAERTHNLETTARELGGRRQAGQASRKSDREGDREGDR
jgi:hypothetical protein